jgi:hypothetical protein
MMKISGHKTTEVFTRYNIFSPDDVTTAHAYAFSTDDVTTAHAYAGTQRFN